MQDPFKALSLTTECLTRVGGTGKDKGLVAGQAHFARDEVINSFDDTSYSGTQY